MVFFIIQTMTNKATLRPTRRQRQRAKKRGGWMDRASSKIALRSIPTPFVVKPFEIKSSPMSKEDELAWKEYHKQLSEDNEWRNDK